MLYYIPLEQYKTRYTADWVYQFENEFKKSKIKFKTILTDSISNEVSEQGVLSGAGTGFYKCGQLKEILKLIYSGKIKNEDIIFFADLWFPGIENLFYCRNLLNLNFKICGIVHAGTYDPYDFTVRTGMKRWGRYMERAIFNEADRIYVATRFHKSLILRNFKDLKNLNKKIFVSGLPFYAEELWNKYGGVQKQDIVVFPHRIAPEKHPEIFEQLSKRYANLKFVKTIEASKSRDEYFNLMSRSKYMVSFAEQETFGYSTLEAMALGCRVFVPNKLSYKETVPKRYRYDSVAQFLKIFDEQVKKKISFPVKYNNLNTWRNSILRMLKDMEENFYGF